jgi:glutathione S-transferase
VIMRVICEYQSYAEPQLKQIFEALSQPNERKTDDSATDVMHRVAGEARTIEQRLAHSDWVVGESFSAADMMIYPDIRLLLRFLQRPKAHELAARFLPLEVNYPAIARWLDRVAALAGTRANLAAALALGGQALVTRRGDCYPPPTYGYG